MNISTQKGTSDDFPADPFGGIFDFPGGYQNMYTHVYYILSLYSQGPIVPAPPAAKWL